VKLLADIETNGHRDGHTPPVKRNLLGGGNCEWHFDRNL